MPAPGDKQGATVIRAVCTFICTLVLLPVVLPARAEPLSLASHYEASGSNPDGSKYTGTADVKVISDTTYTIAWKIGDATYQGSACG
jgi:hypothetical protein